MMRRWTQSVARARTYAAPKRSRRAMARAAIRLEWLRRRTGRGAGARIVLNLRLGMALDFRFHSGIRLRREAGRDGIPGAHGQTPIPRVVGWAPQRHVLVSPESAAGSERDTESRVASTHERSVIREHDWQSRLLLRVSPLMAARIAPVESRAHAGERATPPSSHSTPFVTLRTTTIHERLRQLSAATTHASPHHTRINTTLVRRAPAQEAHRVADAMRPIPTTVWQRGPRAMMTAAARAFAPQPQPFAAVQRQPVVEPVPVERIEERLRESISVVTERTVKRELERTLRSGAPMNRRLRETIQSEMYDDIVFERERRGER